LEPSNIDDNYESETAMRIREQKALDKLLAGSGCCIFCSIFNPLVLEEHHIAGRKHSDITLTVCANHHAILSRMQGAWPKEWLQKDIPVHKRVALFLKGLSDILRVEADELLGLADDGNKDSGGKE
jgi:hypothetical protein